MTPKGVTDFIERRGQTVTVRRPGSPSVEASVKAFVKDFSPAELQGNLQQGDRRVIVAHLSLVRESWPVPPRYGDQVDAGGLTYVVQSSNPLNIGELVARYDLVVRGG